MGIPHSAFALSICTVPGAFHCPFRVYEFRISAFTPAKPTNSSKAGRIFNAKTPSREAVQPRMSTDEHGLNSPQKNLRACFKNRPIRGPGLQWGQNRHVSCRPRALTRRFRGFLKHALRTSSGAGSRREFQEFARSLIGAPTEQWKLAQGCPESFRGYPGKTSHPMIPPLLTALRSRERET